MKYLGTFTAHDGTTYTDKKRYFWLLSLLLPSERPQPHHSWNSNHVFSNWALFHLQRHSDHHANAIRSYQSLRHFNGLPK